jgi:hypothetical protein
MMVGPLQAAPIGDWVNGDWNSAIFDAVPGIIGDGVFAVLIVGVLVLGYYVAGDSSIAGPTVLAMLLASFAVPILPGTYLSYFTAIVALGFTVAIYTTYRRFVLEP